MGRFFRWKRECSLPYKIFISLQVLVLCFTTVMFWLLRRVWILLTPLDLSQFSIEMFSGDEKFSLESLYIQMHVHILTANYWFIFAWQAKWTSKWRPTGTMHRQIKHCNRIIEGLSAKEAIPKGSHSRKTSAQQVECLYEKRKEKKRK